MANGTTSRKSIQKKAMMHEKKKKKDGIQPMVGDEERHTLRNWVWGHRKIGI